MIEYRNECAGCPPEIGCNMGTCPYLRVPHLICDVCGQECDTLYNTQTGEVVGCDQCLIKLEVDDFE